MVQVKVYALLIFIVLLSQQCTPFKKSGDTAVPGEKYPEVSPDGSWSWFSDPRAIYHKGKKEAFYFGYVNMVGDVMVRSMDLRNLDVNEYNLHPKLEIDDHNVPAFLFLPDGKILAFYCEHNGNIYVRKSKHSESIEEWEDERILLEGKKPNSYCYINPIMLSDEDNRIYLFGRNIVREKGERYQNTQIFCIYSDDLGDTWSDPVNMLDNDGRDNPQYVKYATDHQSRIDFLFTNGHPKLGEDVSIHHMYYQKGNLYQTNGEDIGSFDDVPVEIKKVHKVHDAVKEGVRGWIWDIALAKSGNPVVTFAKYPSKTDHQYFYSRWDGKSWKEYKITDAGAYITIVKPGKKLLEGHYSGGIVLDHSDTRNVYLSRKMGDHFEIEHCWISKSGKIKREFITNQSAADNIRPYIVYDNSLKKPLLMWLNGSYYHYDDYDTGIRFQMGN